MQNVGLPGKEKKMLVGSKKEFLNSFFLSLTNIPYFLLFYWQSFFHDLKTFILVQITGAI